jgi:hypothetical protein
MRSAIAVAALLALACAPQVDLADPSDSDTPEAHPRDVAVHPTSTPKRHRSARRAGLVDVACGAVTMRHKEPGGLRVAAIVRAGSEQLDPGDWFECAIPDETRGAPCKARSVTKKSIEAVCPTHDAAILVPPVPGEWGCNVAPAMQRYCAPTVAKCEQYMAGECDLRRRVFCVYQQSIPDGRLEYAARCYGDERSCELARQNVSATFAKTAPHFLKVGPADAPTGHCHVVRGPSNPARIGDQP